ncbi:MAG: S41 family peptidase [Acidobacteriota bacterium]
MGYLRKFLLVLSAPLVTLVLVGAIGARVQEGQDETLRELKIFTEALSHVSRHYVEEVRLDQLERGAFQGVAESLDPWSSYHDPDRMKQLSEGDHRADIGVLLVKTPQQYVQVACVMPGSPADLAGVEQADYLESIDGLASKDLTLLEAALMLSGPAGTSVKLGYFRDAEEEEGKVVEVVRQDLSGLRVVSERLEGGMALLSVRQLTPGIAREVGDELRRLADSGVSGLVLDLRGNCGGEVSEAAALADHFLPPGTLFKTSTRRGESSYEARGPATWRGSVVTLAGRDTVGEAELVAQALQAGPSRLVGDRTFGKTSLQDLILLDDGAGLHVTVGRFLRADGTELPEDGLEPDEAIQRDGPPAAEQLAAAEEKGDETPAPVLQRKSSDPESGEKVPDRQLERALEILKSSPARKTA